MYLVREKDVEELSLPGRLMRWLFPPKKKKAKNISACVIKVPSGQTVHPAHSHPNEEELIYLIA